MTDGRERTIGRPMLPAGDRTQHPPAGAVGRRKYRASAFCWTARRSSGPLGAPRRSGRPRAPDGPAEGAPDDVDHLVHVRVGLAVLGGGPDAALDVVLEDEDRQGIDGRPQRRGLLEDVDAVLLALDHPGDAADLALHPRQTADELRLVLRIAVTEMARIGPWCRRAAPFSRTHRWSDPSSVGRRPVGRGDLMIPPWSIAGRPRPRRTRLR